MEHMTSFFELLHSYELCEPTPVWCANNESTLCIGHSILCGHVVMGSKCMVIAFTGVKYVPGIRHTLLSPTWLGDKGLEVAWRSPNSFEFYKNG